MRTFKKQESEVFDYDLELEDWFNERDDEDQIKEIVTTCNPPFGLDAPELVNGPTVTDSQDDTIILPKFQLLPGRAGLLRRGKVWIGYGTDKIDYIVTCKVLTELGRRDETEFKIRVREEE